MSDVIHIFFTVSFLSIFPSVLITYSLILFSNEFSIKIVSYISISSGFVGGIIGFIFGLSSSPVVESIASGVFGFLGAFAVYIFGQNWNSGKYVGISIVSFIASFSLLLMYGSEYSRPGKEYDFCINIFSTNNLDDNVVDRMKSHCQPYFPNIYKS